MIPFPALILMAAARCYSLSEPFDVAYRAVLDWWLDETERAGMGWFNTAYYGGA